MRLLVAIAHHGTKNRPHLDRMLQAFRDMSHEVDVVLLTEVAKDLPVDVEQRVGLPSANPWSLPFAHRPLFVDRMEDYDLFLYAEDDTLIEQRHIDTFLELSSRVPEGYLPGLMRFEVAPAGERSMCTVHSYYRWEPGSVFEAGGLTFARFTNDHGACYLLTREQLRRAVASGGYRLDPHESRYDMLVSAATDPYTDCGFTKIFCLERLEDMLVHHLPNIYLGKLGITEEEFDLQLTAVSDIAKNQRSRRQLFEPETSPQHVMWSKHVFPAPATGITEIVPRSAKRVVSVGAGDGRTEALLVDHGHQVRAIPVDHVIGASAASRGVEVLEPSLDALADQDAHSADAVIALDSLPYFADPVAALRACVRILTPGGRLVATVPDHRRYLLRNRLPGSRQTPVPRSWDDDGVHRTDARSLKSWCRSAGLTDVEISHRHATRREPLGDGGFSAAIRGNTLLLTARAPR